MPSLPEPTARRERTAFRLTRRIQICKYRHREAVTVCMVMRTLI